MRILFLLIGLGLLLIGIVMLLLILKELIRGVFRFIALLGRLAVGLVCVLFRGVIRTVRAGWCLARPVMSRAVASVAAAYRFAADKVNRGVRRAAPRLAPHVERVQARAAGIMQKTWSGKDVLIIVLATLVAAPMITVLFVALVPVFVVVGAIVLLQAMFGGGEEKPAPTAETAVREPLRPPPAPVPAAPVCAPVACGRPKQRFRLAATAGVIATLIVLAVAAFVINESSVPRRHRGVNLVMAVEEVPQRAPGRSNTEWMAHLPAKPPAAVAQLLPRDGNTAKSASAQSSSVQVETAVAPLEAEPATSPAILVYQPNVEPPRVLTSNAYLDPSQAEDELLQQVSGYVVGALETQGLEVDGWAPNRLLLKKNLVRSSTTERANGPNHLEQFRVVMEVDLSLPKIEQVRQWLAADNCWVRTKGTAQAYAGAVMMLGGLAIFLRLGTSRRPNE